MTPAMVDALTRAVNAQIEAACQVRDGRAVHLKAEILRLEREAGHLVRFLKGGESVTVRDELQTIEAALQALRVALASLEPHEPSEPPRVHPTWVLARLHQLETLLRTDPVRAREEMRKHLDGDLTLSPLPSPAGERRAELRGRVNANSLLADQEAVHLQVVAGAGFAECYTAPTAHWIDLIGQ